MNNNLLAVIIIFIWLFFGFIGIYQQDAGKFSWGFIIFLMAVPFLPFLTLLLR